MIHRVRRYEPVHEFPAALRNSFNLGYSSVCLFSIYSTLYVDQSKWGIRAIRGAASTRMASLTIRAPTKSLAALM